MWLFLTVPGVGLRCVIVVFPDHLLFNQSSFFTLTLHAFLTYSFSFDQQEGVCHFTTKDNGSLAIFHKSMC